MSDICLTIPLLTVSESNVRQHWAKRATRMRAHRQLTHMRLRVALIGAGITSVFAVSVTLTRVSPRELDDDNLRGALKGVRDGVADAFGVDDRDARITWQYAQARSKEKGVKIEIRRRPT